MTNDKPTNSKKSGVINSLNKLKNVASIAEQNITGDIQQTPTIQEPEKTSQGSQTSASSNEEVVNINQPEKKEEIKSGISKFFEKNEKWNDSMFTTCKIFQLNHDRLKTISTIKKTNLEFLLNNIIDDFFDKNKDEIKKIISQNQKNLF